jgi:hypothetical protein
MITKINEDFNFKLQRNFDVSDITKRIENISSEWFADTTRQELYPNHKETQSIFIYDHSNAWKNGEPYEIVVNDSQKEMQELLKPIVDYLETLHDGMVGKCLFINLPAGKEVLEHEDMGDYLGAVRRHHIAIKTNKDVLFFVGGESKNMEIGDCWEINNSKMHSVINSGNTGRVHLLIDILPNKFINGENNG